MNKDMSRQCTEKDTQMAFNIWKYMQPFILKEIQIEIWFSVFHLSDGQRSEVWYILCRRGCGSFY